MTTPSQFRDEYQTSDNGFLLAHESDLVVFVTPTPENDSYSTPEGASKASNYADVLEMGGSEAVRMPGWAYTSRLPSGWVAAFCVGESCTDSALTGTEAVSFLYLDALSTADGEQ